MLEAGSIAAVLDLHVDDFLVRQLPDHRTQLLGQIDPRAELARVFSGQRRRVQGILHCAVDQIVGHLLGDLHGNLFLRFLGRGAQMRGADHAWMPEQRVFLGGFDRKNVQRCPAHVAGFQRGEQRQLVDQSTTGAVHQHHTLLHLVQCVGVDHVLGLRGFRHVQRDHVGLGEQLVELDLGHAQILGAVFREERVIGQHLQPDPDGLAGHDRTDISRADEAKGLARQLGPHEAGLLPLALVG